jgi:hypothetical protein
VAGQERRLRCLPNELQASPKARIRTSGAKPVNFCGCPKDAVEVTTLPIRPLGALRAAPPVFQFAMLISVVAMTVGERT